MAGTSVGRRANPPLDAARLDMLHSRLSGRAEAVRTVLRASHEAIARYCSATSPPNSARTQAGRATPPASRTGGSGLDATFLIMLLPLTVAGLLLVLRARSTYPATSPARQWVLGSPVATEAKMTPRCKTAPAVDSARVTPPSAAASRTPDRK